MIIFIDSFYDIYFTELLVKTKLQLVKPIYTNSIVPFDKGVAKKLERSNDTLQLCPHSASTKSLDWKSELRLRNSKHISNELQRVKICRNDKKKHS